MTTRDENIEVIESLYGLEIEDIEQLLMDLGFELLSDKAIEMLAERQQARERHYCNQEALRFGTS